MNPAAPCAAHDMLSISSLLNHHPEHNEIQYRYAQELPMLHPVIRGPANPYDPGPRHPYDPGPATGELSPQTDRTQRNRPKKVIPLALVSQMSREDLEIYNSLKYSQQEGYVAQLSVRARNFSIEECAAWRHMLEINAGKPPTSIQVRRFLQHLESLLGIKVPRPEKRYRTNGIMWIDRNWDIVQNFIYILPQIPKDGGPTMGELD
jgi:hypothetical protein